MNIEINHLDQSSRGSLPSPPVSPLMSRRVVNRLETERHSRTAQPPQHPNAQQPRNPRLNSAYNAASTPRVRGLSSDKTSSYYSISDEAKEVSRYASTEAPSSSRHRSDEEEDDTESTESDEDEGADEAEKTKAERLAEKRKMKRFRLTHAQTRYLMNEFAHQAHPDAGQRERLSREIPGLSPRQVQVWFQNRRAKLKRLTIDDQERLITSRALPEDFDLSNTLHSPYGQQYTSLEFENQLLSPSSTSSVYSSMPHSAGSSSIPIEFSPAPSRDHASPYLASPSMDRYPPAAIPGRSHSFPTNLDPQRHIEIDRHEVPSRARAGTHPVPMHQSGSAHGGNYYHYEQAPAPATPASAVYNTQQIKTPTIYPSNVYGHNLPPHMPAAGPATYPPFPTYHAGQTNLQSSQRSTAYQPLAGAYQPLTSYQVPQPFNNNAISQENAYDAALQAQQRSYNVQSFPATTQQPANNLASRRRRGGNYPMYNNNPQ